MHVDYDDDGVFVAKTWTELNHTRWVITHPSLGVPMAATDENGVLTQWVHDDLGRMLSASRDGGSAVTLTHALLIENSFIRGIEALSQTRDNRQTLVHVDDRGRTMESRGWSVQGVSTRETSLEDAFIAIVGRGLDDTGPTP